MKCHYRWHRFLEQQTSVKKRAVASQADDEINSVLKINVSFNMKRTKEMKEINVETYKSDGKHPTRKYNNFTNFTIYSIY
jgi:hypothetical protein